jgi:hypothetical protein
MDEQPDNGREHSRRRRRSSGLACVLVLAVLVACDDEGEPSDGASTTDGGSGSGGTDAGQTDTGGSGAVAATSGGDDSLPGVSRCALPAPHLLACFQWEDIGNPATSAAGVVEEVLQGTWACTHSNERRVARGELPHAVVRATGGHR